MCLFVRLSLCVCFMHVATCVLIGAGVLEKAVFL